MTELALKSCLTSAVATVHSLAMKTKNICLYYPEASIYQQESQAATLYHFCAQLSLAYLAQKQAFIIPGLQRSSSGPQIIPLLIGEDPKRVDRWASLRFVFRDNPSPPHSYPFYRTERWLSEVAF